MFRISSYNTMPIFLFISPAICIWISESSHSGTEVSEQIPCVQKIKKAQMLHVEYSLVYTVSVRYIVPMFL